MNEYMQPLTLLRALLSIHQPFDVYASTRYCATCLDEWPCDHAAALSEALAALEAWISPEEARTIGERAFDAARKKLLP